MSKNYTILAKRLTSVSKVDYENSYIHDKVLPVLNNLADRTGKIGKFGNEHLRLYGTTKRNAQDESSHRINFKYDDDQNYNIASHDVEIFISNQEIADFKAPFDAYNDSRFALEESRNIAMEYALATMLGDPTILTNNATPTVKWDDPLSDPLGEMTTGRKAIRDAIGRDPNRAIIQDDVLVALLKHPDFLSKMQGYNKVAVFNEDHVLEVIQKHLKLPQPPLVASSQYVNSQPGQTITRTKMWNEDFLLYWVPEKPSKKVPAFGYRFGLAPKQNQAKRKFFGINDSKTVRLRPHPEDPDLGDMMKIGWDYQDLILNVNASYLFDGVLT